MKRTGFLVATALGIAIGGLAAAVAVVVGAGPSPAPSATGVRDVPAITAKSVPAPQRSHPAEARSDPPGSLVARFDDPDPEVRHAVAVEMLRSKRDVLAQARALRPATPAGRDLSHRLVIALQTLRAIQRSNDYPKTARHDRTGVWLKYAETVVPEDLLRGERLAYWRQKVAYDKRRVDTGFLPLGDLALSRLELARVRFELGELTGEQYAAAREPHVGAVATWIEEMRGDRRTAAGRVQKIEQRFAHLSPDGRAPSSIAPPRVPDTPRR